MYDGLAEEGLGSFYVPMLAEVVAPFKRGSNFSVISAMGELSWQ